MATKEYIRQMLTILAGAWPNNSANEATIAAYTMGLQDLECDALRAGVLSCLTSCKFFPTISEIRGAVVRLQSTGTPTATEAWEFARLARRVFRVRRCNVADTMIQDMRTSADRYIELMPLYRVHVSRCDAGCFDGYEEPEWPHPLVERIARAMGWPDMFTDNPASDRARFIDAYESALSTARIEAAALPEISQLALNFSKNAMLPGGRR